MQKTGYRNPMQRPEVRVKTIKRLRVTKTFVSNHGVVHRCQGYEPEVLQFLYNNRNVLKFSSSFRDLPRIKYTLDEKVHYYEPDIGVLLKDGRQLLIEVKSMYTLKQDTKKNKEKFKAAVKKCKSLANTSFWLAIVDKKIITWKRLG